MALTVILSDGEALELRQHHDQVIVGGGGALIIEYGRTKESSRILAAGEWREVAENCDPILGSTPGNGQVAVQ